MAHVIFFTVAAVPTEGELDDINAVTALAGYSVSIRNGAVVDEDAEPEEADFVMGTPPPPYDDAGDFPVIDPANIADPTLVQEGDTIVLTDAAGVTLNCVLAVTDGVPTLTCPTTACILKSGIEKLSADKSGSYTNGFTPTIVNGAITVLAGS